MSHRCMDWQRKSIAHLLRFKRAVSTSCQVHSLVHACQVDIVDSTQSCKRDALPEIVHCTYISPSLCRNEAFNSLRASHAAQLLATQVHFTTCCIIPGKQPAQQMVALGTTLGHTVVIKQGRIASGATCALESVQHTTWPAHADSVVGLCEIGAVVDRSGGWRPLAFAVWWPAATVGWRWYRCCCLWLYLCAR